MRILVIEDELKTSAYLKKGLEESGYSVDVANDGHEGLMLAQEEEYDVIVLDVMLPGIDGWTIVSRLRATRETPVLFLTARDEVDDRVRGLELGADDYLVKPFAFVELLARVRTLARRGPVRETSVICVGDLEMDVNRRRVKRGETPCLGVCAGGPIVVVYPDGVWYGGVTPSLLERIVVEHLRDGRVVEDAVFHRLGNSGNSAPSQRP